MHPNDKDAIRAILHSRLAELDALDQATSEDRKPIELDQTSVGRLSRMDSLQVQAMAAASQSRRIIERRRLEQAVKRLDTDEYGWCLNCGEAIAPQRLEIDPTIAVCVRCAAGPR
ncbi:MAG: TraR/DksA family transcriptional regulator [Terricaulis sp.]